jgi:hypothetical protein
MFSNIQFKNTFLEKYDMKTKIYYYITNEMLEINKNKIDQSVLSVALTNNSNTNPNPKNNNHLSSSLTNKIDDELLMMLLSN